MNKTQLLEKILNKKVKDYSFTVLFFVVFTFFIIFVIKPNLTMAFSLRSQLEQLRTLDKSYEQAILNIINLQSSIEAKRDKFHLLDEAFPKEPKVYQIIDDIKTAASSSGTTLKNISVGEIQLRGGVDTVKTKEINVSLEISSDFAGIKNFMVEIYSQRRLKIIKNLDISKLVKQASNEADLKINFSVDSFYL